MLAARTDDFGYANLAIRGRKLDPVIAEQVPTALALEPDLITIYAGGNDILRDARYWDADRLHLGPLGHQRMAIAVLDTLELPHDLGAVDLPARALGSRRDAWDQNSAWARENLAPWIHRRLTGRSSGDTVSRKRPGLAPVD